MKYIASLNGKKYEIEIEKVSNYKPLSREEAAAPAQVAAPVAAPKPVAPAPAAAPVAKPQAAPVAAGNNDVLSPMPGSILDVKVSAGQTVKAGQVLIILEAMKMENEIVAPTDGVVASVLVKKGDTVETDATLVVMK